MSLEDHSGGTSERWLRLEFVTADGQLAARGFRHQLVRIANGLLGVVVDDEEYQLMDLAVPFEKPVLSFVRPGGADTKGREQKHWIQIQYGPDDAGAQEEIHRVRELEPLTNELRHVNVFVYRDGVLRAKWRENWLDSLIGSGTSPAQAPLLWIAL